MRSGLECPCVARVLLRSVALSSSAVELVAVRLLLVLILSHQRTLSGSTHSQFEIVLLLSRCDRRSLIIQSAPVDPGASARFPTLFEQKNKFRSLPAPTATLLL